MNTNIDDRDWTQLSFGERTRQLELEGYLVLPDLLDADQIAELKMETRELETTAVDYSVHQRGCPEIQFHGGKISELVGHSFVTTFLKRLFGSELVIMSYAYARSEPGHPGISLHTDGQPYGSAIFGYEGSCPVMVRVLFYLDDLTPEVSPFKVVPRSHLSLHSDGNPYTRYAEHPDEIMVTAKAGSAVLINHRVFHGNYPNTGDYAREMLAIAYRPTWAGPITEVETWPSEDVAKLDRTLNQFFGDKNQRDFDFDGGNKPANMASRADGISPTRWESK